MPNSWLNNNCNVKIHCLSFRIEGKGGDQYFVNIQCQYKNWDQNASNMLQANNIIQVIRGQLNETNAINTDQQH